MIHKTYLPCDLLKPFVKHFSIMETSEEQTYKVLPDTGVVIGFQYKGRLSQVQKDSEIMLAISGITGMRDGYQMFKNTVNIGTLLVVFREAGAAPFFKQPIHELFRENISLDHFMLRSELLILEEQLCESKKDLERISLVEQFLTARMRQTKPDLLVLTAISLIYKSKGTIRIKDLVQQLHFSQSPLEKRFRQVVGISPKKFTAIVRFRHTMQSCNLRNSLTALGYEAGFYDQAHFIKEFKNFTGETPESFFPPTGEK